MATQTHDAVTAPTTTRDDPSGVRPPRTWGSVLRYIGIAVALIYALFPVVFIISSAFNPGGTLTTTSLIPKGASLVNFTDLFALRPYWSWYKNSLIICGVAHGRVGASSALWPRSRSPASGSGVAVPVCWPCCWSRCSPRC